MQLELDSPYLYTFLLVIIGNVCPNSDLLRDMMRKNTAVTTFNFTSQGYLSPNHHWALHHNLLMPNSSCMSKPYRLAVIAA